MTPAPDRDQLLAADDETLSAGCEFEFCKGSGNGGQKRNKTSSAVRVRHLATGLTAEDCSERSQHRNRAAALAKLRMELALHLRRLPAQPPERSVTALEHPDYPMWCARVLDVFEEHGFDHKPAAEALAVSPTALVKLLARDPRLFQFVNQERARRGLTILRR